MESRIFFIYSSIRVKLDVMVSDSTTILYPNTGESIMLQKFHSDEAYIMAGGDAFVSSLHLFKCQTIHILHD